MASLRRRPQKATLFGTSTVSVFIHAALIVLFTLNPWPVWMKTQPIVYSVTLMSMPLSEPEIPKAEAMPAPKAVPVEKKKPVEKPLKVEKPKPVEKPIEKPIEKPKKEDLVEKVKKPLPKVEKPDEEKETRKHIQEALEEIRRKVTLDEIRKRVAGREKTEEQPKVVNPPKTPVASPSKVSAPTPPPSARSESALNEYYSLIWARIKGEWTIPENLLKEMVDLETIIVVIIERDGRIQKSWFEKKSGNALYDQSAMRAIKKADPLPAIPKELNENALEVGIRFIPE